MAGIEGEFSDKEGNGEQEYHPKASGVLQTPAELALYVRFLFADLEETVNLELVKVDFVSNYLADRLLNCLVFLEEMAHKIDHIYAKAQFPVKVFLTRGARPSPFVFHQCFLVSILAG